MKDFVLELKLALQDYFCGTVTEENDKIVLALENGQTFFVCVEQA